MSFWIGIAAGYAACWVLTRTVLRYARRAFRPDRSDRFRKDMLDKMGYDSLVVFETAVKAELARRRGQADA